MAATSASGSPTARSTCRAPLRADSALSVLDSAIEQIGRNSRSIEIARTALDIVRIHGRGKSAAVFNIEGSFDLDGAPAVIRQDVRHGHALGAPFRPQLEQQIYRTADAGREMARVERLRAAK